MGITDYITRPFDTVIVKKRVQNTLDLYVNQKRLINVVVDQLLLPLPGAPEGKPY